MVIRDDLNWQSNTDLIVKQAYQRMLLLHKLYEFQMPIDEMTEIYTLYIWSILKSSVVVWHSSITQGEVIQIEMVQ